MDKKERNAAYFRKWYEANKKKQIERVAANKKKNAQFIRKIKEDGECLNCGQDHPATLSFHHRNPSEKSYNIYSMPSEGYGIETIRAEIAKCDLLCENCHRILHYEMK